MDNDKVEKIILKTGNKNLLATFLVKNGREKEAKKIREDCYNSLVEWGDWEGAMEYAQKYNLSKDSITQAAHKLFDQCIGKREYLQAIEIAKKYLNPQKIQEAERANFDYIINNEGRDPSSAIEYAILSKDVKLTKQIMNVAFIRFLRWEKFEECSSLLSKYASYFTEEYKNVLSIFKN